MNWGWYTALNRLNHNGLGWILITWSLILHCFAFCITVYTSVKCVPDAPKSRFSNHARERIRHSRCTGKNETGGSKVLVSHSLWNTSLQCLLWSTVITIGHTDENNNSIFNCQASERDTVRLKILGQILSWCKVAQLHWSPWSNANLNQPRLWHIRLQKSQIASPVLL